MADPAVCQRESGQVSAYLSALQPLILACLFDMRGVWGRRRSQYVPLAGYPADPSLKLISKFNVLHVDLCKLGGPW